MEIMGYFFLWCGFVGAIFSILSLVGSLNKAGKGAKFANTANMHSNAAWGNTAQSDFLDQMMQEQNNRMVQEQNDRMVQEQNDRFMQESLDNSKSIMDGGTNFGIDLTNHDFLAGGNGFSDFGGFGGFGL